MEHKVPRWLVACSGTTSHLTEAHRELCPCLLWLEVPQVPSLPPSLPYTSSLWQSSCPLPTHNEPFSGWGNPCSCLCSLVHLLSKCYHRRCVPQMLLHLDCLYKTRVWRKINTPMEYAQAPGSNRIISCSFPLNLFLWHPGFLGEALALATQRCMSLLHDFG